MKKTLKIYQIFSKIALIRLRKIRLYTNQVGFQSFPKSSQSLRTQTTSRNKDKNQSNQSESNAR